MSSKGGGRGSVFFAWDDGDDKNSTKAADGGGTTLKQVTVEQTNEAIAARRQAIVGLLPLPWSFILNR